MLGAAPLYPMAYDQRNGAGQPLSVRLHPRQPRDPADARAFTRVSWIRVLVGALKLLQEGAREISAGLIRTG